jgi:hypothetical protein
VIHVLLAICAVGATSCAGSGAGKAPSTSGTTSVEHSECVTDMDCASTYHCSDGKCVIGSGAISSGGGGWCPPSHRTFGDRCR